MNTAIKNQRFVVCEPDYIVDELNSTNNGKGHYFKGDPDDDMHLRECVLRRRLSDLVNDLITNNNPIRKLPNGEEYKPTCEESFCLWWVLFESIRASHLNTFPVEHVLYDRGGPARVAFDKMQQGTVAQMMTPDVLVLIAHETCRPYIIKTKSNVLQEVDARLPRPFAVKARVERLAAAVAPGDAPAIQRRRGRPPKTTNAAVSR